MRKNLAKEKIKKGEPAIGVLLKIPSPAVIELCAHAGFDFVLMDIEEGPTNVAICEELARAAEATGIALMVRVHVLDAKVISRFLDAGALGVQIPHVISRAQAALAVCYAKYHPDGKRGIGAVRAADYGVSAPVSQYVQQANRETMVVAMVEDVEAVENLEEILAVPGIDVICIGPTDLSQSLGLPGQVGHEKVQQTIRQVVAKVRESDKALGVPGVDAETTKRYLGEGARYVALSAEALFVNAAREYLGKVRA